MTTAIEQVRASLRRSLAETTFDMGRTLTARRGRRTTSYASRSDETLRPERLREMHERAKWDDEELRRAKGARVLIPQSLSSELADSLRNALVDYLDPVSDSVGHAIPTAGDRGVVVKAVRNGL